MSLFKFLLLSLFSLTLLACAQQPKKNDGTPITVSDVKANSAVFKGKKVRWAGNIVSVKNQKNHTLIEVLGRKLNVFGNTNDTGIEQGRFFAKFAGFKDPAQYAKGKLLLVNGTVDGLKAGKIGQHNYTYPVIIVNSHDLSERYYNSSSGSSWHWGLGWGWGRGGHGGGRIGVGWGGGY